MATPRLVSGSYEDLYAKARQHLRDGEPDKAQEILARLHRRLGKMGDNLFARRPELKNLYLVSTAQLALSLRQQHKFGEALDYYQMLLDLAPENSMNWQIAIAVTKIDQGQVETGLDELRAVAMMHPGESLPWLSLGVELHGSGDYNESERSLKHALEGEDPEKTHHLSIYSHLFNLYGRQGRYDEAEEAWQNVERLSEAETKVVYPLYDMYWEAGNLEKTHFWLSKEKNPLRKGLYQGLLAQAEGDALRAKSLWKKTAAKDPFDYEHGQESWAEASLRTTNEEHEVIGVLNTVLQHGEPDTRTLVLLASAEARIGHLDHAESALKTAVNLLKSYRPRRDRLEARFWGLFDELVPDEAIKEQLKSYFENGAT